MNIINGEHAVLKASVLSLINKETRSLQNNDSIRIQYIIYTINRQHRLSSGRKPVSARAV